VKKVAPTPRFTEAKPAVDSETLQAVITHRYDVLAKYAKSAQAHLRRGARQAAPARAARRARAEEPESAGCIATKNRCARPSARTSSRAWQSRARFTPCTRCAQKLASLWERSKVSREQLVRQLQDWSTAPKRAASAASRILAPAALLRIEGFAAREAEAEKTPPPAGFFHWDFNRSGFSG